MNHSTHRRRGRLAAVRDGEPLEVLDVTLHAGGTSAVRCRRTPAQLVTPEGHRLLLDVERADLRGARSEILAEGSWGDVSASEPLAALFEDVAPGPHVDVKLEVRAVRPDVEVTVIGELERVSDPATFRAPAPAERLRVTRIELPRAKPSKASPRTPRGPFPWLAAIWAAVAATWTAGAAWGLFRASQLSEAHRDVALLAAAGIGAPALAALAELVSLRSDARPLGGRDLVPTFVGRGVPLGDRIEADATVGVLAWLGPLFGLVFVLGALEAAVDKGWEARGRTKGGAIAAAAGQQVRCFGAVSWLGGALVSGWILYRNRRGILLVRRLRAEPTPVGAWVAGRWVAVRGRVVGGRGPRHVSTLRRTRGYHPDNGNVEQLDDVAFDVEAEDGRRVRVGPGAVFGTTFVDVRVPTVSEGRVVVSERLVPEDALVRVQGHLAQEATGHAIVARGPESLLVLATSEGAVGGGLALALGLAVATIGGVVAAVVVMVLP